MVCVDGYSGGGEAICGVDGTPEDYEDYAARWYMPGTWQTWTNPPRYAINFKIPGCSPVKCPAFSNGTTTVAGCECDSGYVAQQADEWNTQSVNSITSATPADAHTQHCGGNQCNGTLATGTVSGVVYSGCNGVSGSTCVPTCSDSTNFFNTAAFTLWCLQDGSFNASASASCVAKGVCSASDCAANDKKLKSSPQPCATDTCDATECCDTVTPTTSSSATDPETETTTPVATETSDGTGTVTTATVAGTIELVGNCSAYTQEDRAGLIGNLTGAMVAAVPGLEDATITWENCTIAYEATVDATVLANLKTTIQQTFGCDTATGCGESGRTKLNEILEAFALAHPDHGAALTVGEIADTSPKASEAPTTSPQEPGDDTTPAQGLVVGFSVVAVTLALFA